MVKTLGEKNSGELSLSLARSAPNLLLARAHTHAVVVCNLFSVFYNNSASSQIATSPAHRGTSRFPGWRHSGTREHKWNNNVYCFRRLRPHAVVAGVGDYEHFSKIKGKKKEKAKKKREKNNRHRPFNKPWTATCARNTMSRIVMRRRPFLKSILNVADPRAPTRGRTWANARYWTAILKKAGSTIGARRLHGTLVTFTSPESHLVSLSIQSLNEKKKKKRKERISNRKRRSSEGSARELSFDWPGHALVYT